MDDPNHYDDAETGLCVPDYENDLNACMAVIRERWPRADIHIYFTREDRVDLEIEAESWGQYIAPTLAEALLGALEAEK